MDKTIRSGKIHGRNQKMASHWRGNRDVAWLNLCGQWLEQAGFKVGDGIVIEVQNGQLVIKKQLADGDR